MNEMIKEIEGLLFWYKKEISNGGIPTIAGKMYVDHVEYLLSKIKELEEGIEELLVYGMPPHIEEGLKKLVEKG